MALGIICEIGGCYPCNHRAAYCIYFFLKKAMLAFTAVAKSLVKVFSL